MTQVRIADPGQARSLVRLIRSAYRGDVSREGWTSEADLVAGRRISLRQVRRNIRAQGSMMVALTGHHEIIACCQLTDLGDDLALLGTFAVAPARQRGGLGGRMLAEAERLAAATFGSRAIEITVLAQQEALLAWYERHGYRRTGEQRPFPADPRYARPLREGLYFIVLAKDLGGASTSS